jgi:hypothetical protein
MLRVVESNCLLKCTTNMTLIKRSRVTAPTYWCRAGVRGPVLNPAMLPARNLTSGATMREATTVHPLPPSRGQQRSRWRTEMEPLVNRTVCIDLKPLYAPGSVFHTREDLQRKLVQAFPSDWTKQQKPDFILGARVVVFAHDHR